MARLERFRTAQDSPHSGFEAALSEIRSGAKRNHWIWYIFPQLSGLGASHQSRSFAIEDEGEAAAFLRDTELRSRLLQIASAVADQLRRGVSLRGLMGSDIDARKVVSSLTLFGDVAKRMSAVEADDAIDSIARLAAEVLALADMQGYPACAFTLGRLREMRPWSSAAPEDP